MKTKNIFFSFITILLVISCRHLPQEKKNLNIYINPLQTGWFFVALQLDSSVNPDSIEVKITDREKIQSVMLSRFENFNFKIFSLAGEKISNKIKMPAFVYHTNDYWFYRFYNPTPVELANEDNWNPKGPVMEELRGSSIVELNKRLNPQ